MTIWRNDHWPNYQLTKWPFDQTTNLQKDHLTKWRVDESTKPLKVFIDKSAALAGLNFLTSFFFFFESHWKSHFCHFRYFSLISSSKIMGSIRRIEPTGKKNWMLRLTLVMFLMPVMATLDSYYCTCLGRLGQRDTDRIISISHLAKASNGSLTLAMFLRKKCWQQWNSAIPIVLALATLGSATQIGSFLFLSFGEGK